MADVDMMDISGCPAGEACEVCGDTTDLRVSFLIHPEDSNELGPDAGVLCYTACCQHAMASVQDITRVRDAVHDAVLRHCDHLNVSHDAMLAWLRQV